jgi:hypothetical protein
MSGKSNESGGQSRPDASMMESQEATTSKAFQQGPKGFVTAASTGTTSLIPILATADKSTDAMDVDDSPPAANYEFEMAKRAADTENEQAVAVSDYSGAVESVTSASVNLADAPKHADTRGI